MDAGLVKISQSATSSTHGQSKEKLLPRAPSISGKKVVGKQDFYSIMHQQRRLNAAKAAMQYEADFKQRQESPEKTTSNKQSNQAALRQNFMPPRGGPPNQQPEPFSGQPTR